jgi:hypothetical protein
MMKERESSLASIMTSLADQLASSSLVSNIWSYVVTAGWPLVGMMVIGVIFYRYYWMTHNTNRGGGAAGAGTLNNNNNTNIPIPSSAITGGGVTPIAARSSSLSSSSSSSSTAAAMRRRRVGPATPTGGTLSSTYSIGVAATYEHHPSFMTGSLAAAIDEAKSQNR